MQKYNNWMIFARLGEKKQTRRQNIMIIIIMVKLYLNTVLFHKLLTFNLIMYKREGKEKCDLPIGRVFNYLITLSTIYI